MQLNSPLGGAVPRSYALIWRAVGRIPAGAVASYAQVARAAGLPGCARLVGMALRGAPPGMDLPWHRVISAAGTITLPGRSGRRQAALLRAEGVRVVGLRVDRRRFRPTALRSRVPSRRAGA